MFGPGSLTWRVNGEAVLLLGGGRALILQVAHPKVAAGVAEFSELPGGPVGPALPDAGGDAADRLRRPRDLARRLGGIAPRPPARRWEGTTVASPTGRWTPSCLLWVHATLIETSLTIYERYVAALTPRERGLYYEEMKDLGEAYSVPRDAMPADYVAFRRYWASMLAGGLRLTEITREVADAVLRPDLPRVAWPATEAIRLVTVGTLPELAARRAGARLGTWPGAAARRLAGSRSGA